MDPKDLPKGWRVRQTRYMWALVNPQDRDVSFGLSPEIVAEAYWLKPEHGAVTGAAKDVSGHVDL